MKRSDNLGPLIWQRLFRRFESSGASLQARLRDTLAHAVLEGILAPGASIPSSRWLADSLHVSRTTTTLVLQRLCSEGMLVAHPRSGYIVDPGYVESKVTSVDPRHLSVDPNVPDWNARIDSRLGLQRNIEKPHDWQRYPFPFIYGQFDATLFPFADWRECVLESLRKGEVAKWAPDLIDRDSPALINEIRQHLLPARGIWVSHDSILVTAGAQQAIYMVATLLLRRGTTVGIENPGFPDARNNFLLRSQNVRALPVDADGLIVDGSVARCRYVFVTPSHQCPTTVTMTLERRLELLECAARCDIVIIEDDHESELNHLGRPTAALKSLDTSGRVIYVGSLSKTLAHGVRIGYVVATSSLIHELRALRRLMIRHPATNNEHAAALFVRHGFHEAYLRKLNHTYAERAGVLRASLTRHIPQAAHVRATGGSALWVRLPQEIDTGILAREVLRHGIVIEPGEIFFSGRRRPRNYLRMGYSSIGIDHIDQGVRLLADLVSGAN